LILLLSYLVALKISRPIREITLGAQKLAAGDLGLRLQTRGSDEIASLCASINTMAEKLSVKIRELSTGKQRLEQILAAMGEVSWSSTVRGKSASPPGIGDILGTRSETLGKTPAEILNSEVLTGGVERLVKTASRAPSSLRPNPAACCGHTWRRSLPNPASWMRS